MDISKFTVDELKRELERKEREREATAPPTPLLHPDWSVVISDCISHVAERWKDGWHDDRSVHYIYEAAMEAVYGADIFAKLNKRAK